MGFDIRPFNGQACAVGTNTHSMADKRVMAYMARLWARVEALDCPADVKPAKPVKGAGRAQAELAWYEPVPSVQVKRQKWLPRRSIAIGYYSALGHVNRPTNKQQSINKKSKRKRSK